MPIRPCGRSWTGKFPIFCYSGVCRFVDMLIYVKGFISRSRKSLRPGATTTLFFLAHSTQALRKRSTSRIIWPAIGDFHTVWAFSDTTRSWIGNKRAFGKTMGKIVRQKNSANNGGLERNHHKKSIEGHFNSGHVQLHHKHNVSTVLEHRDNNPFYAEYTE